MSSFTTWRVSPWQVASSCSLSVACGFMGSRKALGGTHGELPEKVLEKEDMSVHAHVGAFVHVTVRVS